MRTALAATSLLALAATAHAVHAAPAAPASFVSAMRDYGCDKTAWTKLPDDTWLARCDTASKEPDGKKLAAASHNAVLFHHAGVAATFEIVDLADWTTQKPYRPADFDETGTFELHGSTLSLERHGPTGELRREVWDASAFPPKLVARADGGGNTWSNAKAPSYPTCSLDFAQHRESCDEDLPSCDGSGAPDPDDWLGDKVHYGALPALEHAALPSDPFACGAVFGGAGSDTYFGVNAKHTTFDAIVETTQLSQKAPRQLVLHVRAHDATPNLAAAKGAWQTADHWELWLARAGTAVAAWRADRAGYCAARTNDYVQLIVAVHADGSVELANGTPKAGAITGAAARTEAHGAGLAITLDDPLASWALDGAITIAYSDSETGAKQDSLIGSSRVVWGKPASFGRLGSDRLCPAPPIAVSSHVWP